MSSRSRIFERIRAATAGIPEKQPHPDFDDAQLLAARRLDGGDLWEVFSRNFRAVNGRPMATVAELTAFLSEHGHTRGYCDPALLPALGDALAAAGLQVETTFDRTRVDDYAFGITRATAAIAESGSLVIDDETTSDRLAALAPWVHVAVIHRATIVRTIPEALANLGDSPNIIWVTGPSKTADVEGILIEGVHGPGEEIALLL
jgi:L-lactate dehydrogenase complex protein LldG